MEIGPILRAMARNKLGVLLIAVQIAFTMTVIINAVFIINERSSLMARPSGMDESNTFYLYSLGYGEDFNEAVTVADDLDMLRRTPGISNATVISAIPLSSSGSSTGARLSPDESQPSVGTAIYRGDEMVLDTMGLELVAGTNFTAVDVRNRVSNDKNSSPITIISEPLASELFPGKTSNEIIGETIYLPGEVALQVVGIVARLQAPWPTFTGVERSLIVPENYIDGGSIYLIRAEPGQRDRLMVEVEEMLAGSGATRVIRDLKSLEETRVEIYTIDSAMSTILWIVNITLIFITCMGIVGLAVFSINGRRKQIGTRRALGATRFEILRYFMLENFLITGIGVCVGAALTIGFSIVLTSSFDMPTMAWYYTPIGMGCLLLIGQLAVFGPSSGAARTEPAIATRSV